MRAISLFAGIGGICMGFKQAGFDIVWANEIAEAAKRGTILGADRILPNDTGLEGILCVVDNIRVK